MISDIITISPQIQSGLPVFSNTRVPIKNFFDYLKAGDTLDEFLNDFPSVKREQAERLLNFAEQMTTFQFYEKNIA